jgi:hypothetical protein
MKGQLIQINNIDGESIGFWYTEDATITSFMLADWFRSYDNSDRYDEEGIDGFSEFVKEIGYTVERVFVEEEFL